MKHLMLFTKMFLVSLLVVLTSCVEESTYKYDPDFNLDLQEYTMNFVKQYGKVNPEKDWDMSSENLRTLVTRASEGIEIKPVAGLNFNVSNTFSWGTLKSEIKLNKELYNNIREILPDGKKTEGVSAVLVAPSNSFMIYPVMAQGAYTYDLYVKVGDLDEFLVFSKTWDKYDKPYVNGMGISGTNSKNLVCANMGGIFIKAPIGTPIQVYLRNIKNGNKLVTNNPIGTTSGNAIVVNSTARPEGLGKDIMPDNAVIKYIGIEDSENFGDRDYNDLVLAVVGNPYTPEDIQITEEFYKYSTTCSKRYLVEDLGIKDDFDFNDIVVDVTDTTTNTYKIVKTNGIITENTFVKSETKQYAVVKHLGGMLPFTLKIGDSVLPEILPSLDSNPNSKYEISGWIPEINNIIITVLNKQNEGVEIIRFPRIGEIPLIIATDTTTQWMPERVSIPDEWCK